MYWCKPNPNPSPNERGFIKALFAIALVSGIALVSSCSKPDVKDDGKLTYFDIKGYFKADSARLTRKHPYITKTVVQNGVSQTKKVYIGNWGNEFAPFINSDINKPAWRNSYKVNKSDSVIVYTDTTADLKTSRIVINKKGDKVRWILIFNHTKNMLYENTEKLTYFPDSVYVIDKLQQVRLLGKNLYSVKGMF